MSLHTLNDIFFAVAGRDQPQLMLRKTARGWEPIASVEFAAQVAGVARALQSYGIHCGDRVAILSENRHEWVVADFACLLRGAIVVPIYTTLTSVQTAYLLRDSGAQAIFVSSQKHLEKVAAILNTTAVKKIVIMDDVADARASRMADLMQLPGGPQSDSIAHSI